MKAVKKLTVLSIVLGVFFMYKTKEKSTDDSDMTLKNVEALAQGEDDNKGKDCFFIGSVKCHNGGYSKLQFLSLDEWD